MRLERRDSNLRLWLVMGKQGTQQGVEGKLSRGERMSDEGEERQHCIDQYGRLVRKLQAAGTRRVRVIWPARASSALAPGLLGVQCRQCRCSGGGWAVPGQGGLRAHTAGPILLVVAMDCRVTMKPSGAEFRTGMRRGAGATATCLHRKPFDLSLSPDGPAHPLWAFDWVRVGDSFALLSTVEGIVHGAKPRPWRQLTWRGVELARAVADTTDGWSQHLHPVTTGRIISLICGMLATARDIIKFPGTVISGKIGISGKSRGLGNAVSWIRDVVDFSRPRCRFENPVRCIH